MDNGSWMLFWTSIICSVACGALGVQAGFFLKARTPEEKEKDVG